MYSFRNDYNEIAHPNILQALIKHNYTQTVGYGEDEFCKEAKGMIQKIFQTQEGDMYFFMAGTQTNLTIIDKMLTSYEAIIATDTAHINVHEAGAIESCGHKILLAPNKDGKLLPEDIDRICKAHFADDHMSLPKAVYISNSTELGSIYKKKELIAIYEACQRNHLYLFLDGARLGSALMARDNDIQPSDLAKYCDVFYIGGTKNGALLGEAAVIMNDTLKAHFIRHMKSRGTIYAKGKVTGIGFIELFKDNLYFDLAKHANTMAYKIYDALKDSYSFLCPVESNQIFILLEKKLLDDFKKEFVVEEMQEIDANTKCVRIVTSWATKEEEVDRLISFLQACK